MKLTPAEHRVLQVLLHLTNPVSLRTLAPAAAHFHRAANPINARQVIHHLAKKKPRLGIHVVWGKGYALASGRTCRYCKAGKVAVREMCAVCIKVWKQG